MKFKMKFVIWSSFPSCNNLKDAKSNAKANYYLHFGNNVKLFREAWKFIVAVWNFLQCYFFEIRTNIRHGLIWKLKSFMKAIQEEKANSKDHDLNVWRIFLKTIGTGTNLTGKVEKLEDVLNEGNPVLIVSNHPYVPLDGISLMSIVHQKRKDYSIMVNGNNSLGSFFKDKKRFIPVKLSSGLLKISDKKTAVESGRNAFKKCSDYLDSGRCLIVFPAGAGSKAKNWGDKIVDPQWKNGMGRLIADILKSKKKLTVVPIHIGGAHMGTEESSRRYSEAVLESPNKLGSALQFALLNPPPKIDVRIMDVLDQSHFAGMSANEITLKLRSLVYMGTADFPIATKARNLKRVS